eukprot:jgi/Tetstr1/430281/TSEL_020108.t1
MEAPQRLSAADAAAAAAAASAQSRLGRPPANGNTAGAGSSPAIDNKLFSPDRPSPPHRPRTPPNPTTHDANDKSHATADGGPGIGWLAGPVLGSFLGNALLLAVGALLTVVWGLFEEFREPLLWGLWCSIALRGAKEYLVMWLQEFLSSRSLFSFVTLPVELVCGISYTLARDSCEIAVAWSRAMDAKAGERAALLRVRSLAEKAQADVATGSDGEEVFEDASEVPEVQPTGKLGQAYQTVREVSSWCWECTQLLMSEAWKRKQYYVELVQTKDAAHKASDTMLLFAALLSCCLLFEGFRFVRAFVGWRALYTIWALVAICSTGYVIARIALAFVGKDMNYPQTQKAVDAATKAWDAASAAAAKAQGALKGVSASAMQPVRNFEARMRSSLLENLDQYVAGMLCLLVLLGAIFGAVFFVVQIGSEMHGAVTVAMNVEVNMGNMTKEGVMQYVPESLLKQVDEGKAQASALIKENMPKAIKVMEDQANEMVAAYNLTEVVSEMYIMYATAQCIPCTAEELQEFAVAAAKANSIERHAATVSEAAEQEVVAAERQLEMAVEQWKLRTSAALAGPAASDASCAAPTGDGEMAPGQPGADTCGGGTAEHAAGTPISEAQAEQEVVESDARVASALATQARAAGELAAAKAAAALAGKRLQRCYHAERALQDGGQAPLFSGEHLARLKSALMLLARFQFAEALQEIQAAVRETLAHLERVGSSRDLTAGVDTDKLAEPMTSYGQAFIDPVKDLVQSVGGSVLSSLGNSMSFLASGGASVVSSIMGIITASINFISFVGLLYFLLSLDEDPIDTVIGVIPVEPSRQATINTAVRSALSGVFEVTVKIAAFNGLLTWLSLRVLGAHFVYLPTLAAIVFSCFPLIPVMVVIIPAILEFVIAGAWVRAIVLAAAFLAAGSAGDVIADEVPGTNQFLTGMAIAGGMATFDNAFQGALLGPMLIALLLMLKNLASEFAAEFSKSATAQE